jgi:MFS family permease
MSLADILAGALLLSLTFYALMGGVGFPAITIMISEETRGGKGATMMLRQVGTSSSQAIGAAVGGALLALGGYPLLGFGMGGFALLSAVALLLAAEAKTTTRAEPATAEE